MCHYKAAPNSNRDESEFSVSSKYVLVRLAAVMLFAGSTVIPAFAKTVLPDACGDVKTKFEISEKKDQPPPAGPEDGKALLVFVGTVPTSHFASLPPIRYGLDGQWAGATKEKSYFAVSVSPGLHHLCAATHGNMGPRIRAAVPLDVTVESGKTYYFEAQDTVVQGSAPPMISGGGAPGQPSPMVVGGGTHSSGSFSFLPLSDAEGKYRVKAWNLSVSTPK
jgi:hypothetical protein